MINFAVGYIGPDASKYTRDFSELKEYVMNEDFFVNLYGWGLENSDKIGVAIAVLISASLLRFIKGKVGAWWRQENVPVRPFVKELLRDLENEVWKLHSANGSIASNNGKFNIKIARLNYWPPRVSAIPDGYASGSEISGDFNGKELLLIENAAYKIFTKLVNENLPKKLNDSVPF